MGWLFATVVLLLIVFIPALRKIALALIAIIVVTVLINIADDDKKKKTKEAEVVAQSAVWAAEQEQLERARIFPLSEVSLSEISLSLTNGGNFSGRIHNNSKGKALGSLALKLSISDCEKWDESNCVVIGERNIYLETAVPSGQARDFQRSLDFYVSPIVIRGYMRIDTKLTRASQ